MSPIFIRERGDVECKFWIEPKIELSENFGFKAFEVNEIKKIIEINETKFKETWNKYFC